jgi:peptidoglycan/xylan/chitin deacetylase (PgdA/CDA1 family)
MAIQNRAVAQVHGGGVVLMHDGGGDRSETVAQLPGLIDRLRAAGYSLVVP